MRKLRNSIKLMMFGAVTAMALAACGGSGDSVPQPKTTVLSGEVRVPSTTTAPTLEIRDLSGSVVTTIPLTPKTGTAYTYSLPSLAIDSDYVLISTNGSMVLRALIDKAALSGASTTKNVDTYSTTAIIVVEKALTTPTPPGTLGSKNATSAQTQAASAAIATLPPTTIENNLTTSLAACTSGTATQAQAQLSSLVNIVMAAVSSNLDPAAFVAGTTTTPAVTATTYTVSGTTATPSTASVTSASAGTLADTVAATLPRISSASSTTFTVGTAGSFTVTGTGTLSIAGTLPSGVTFNAASGVLSGTPASGSNSTTLTFTATSSGLTATQTFTLTVTPAATPPPAVPTGTTATAGSGQVTVSWTAVAGATSYNIYYAASTGVTKGTGTKVAGAVSPRAVTGLTNNTTYFFVVTAVNANGESAESSQVSATPAAPVVANFTQADLTGNWNFIQFVAGPEVTAGTHFGWMRGNATIDASGNVTVNSIQDSTGTATAPPAGTITETIDSNGVVTEGGINGAGENHAVMAANKQLVVGIGTTGNNSPNQAFRIFVKQIGTFSNADISSATFAYSQLKTGANSSWQFGTGSINAAQQVTLTSILDSNGPTTLPPPNNVTLAITADGIVTNSSVNAEPTFQGVMTPDKKLIIGTENNTGGGYKLRIIAIGGQTFSTADLAGTWKFNQLYTSSIWEYGTMSFNSAGIGTPLSDLDSTGSTTLGTGPTLSVSLAGFITMAGRPSTNGVMAFGKNIFVATDTNATGVFSMSIAVK